MNSNSENPRRGKAFQEAVKEWFETSKQHPYELERPIPIGNPAKPHKFDIVEANGKVVIECKCYTWTEAGNVPSAKMGFTNEAAFYLSFLPDTIEKIIVMSRSTHPKRNETLAEYYYRTNHHLLKNITVMEYDVGEKKMRIIGENKWTEVVAALIWDQDKFMICQRPANKARGLLWEFVGGKVEPGETKEQALIRECQEELAITPDVGKVFMDVVHEYPDLTVHLTLFNASIREGTPQKLEHNDIRWIKVDEIDGYDFCPADEVILRKLKAIK